MNKTIFFTGLGIIILELLGIGGYALSQQTEQFINTFVLVITVGAVNFTAVVMMLIGLFSE